MPESFCFAITFPAYRIDIEPDLFRPLVFTPDTENRCQNTLFPLARLKPGVTVREADNEMKLIMARLEMDGQVIGCTVLSLGTAFPTWPLK